MTDKELKKLSRAELLEMLLSQTELVELQKKQLEELQKQLRDRKLEISYAGSIAEAALQINGVFEAAQRAADQYLENVSQLQFRCDQIEADSRSRADRMIREAEQQCAALERDTQRRCDEMVSRARTESQKWWEEAAEKVERFRAAQTDLKDFLTAFNPGEAKP